MPCDLGPFDVLVIGGGHAGVEASLAAARMGAQTCLLTQSIETIGQMSCNPAIGGIGKSHLVKEIDALGGAMALAADHAGIQFRTLNSSKGPAVRATRAQADRVLYKAAIRRIVENQTDLVLWQDEVVDLIVKNDCIRGALTRLGLEILAETIVLTTGTFLGGKIYMGEARHVGGRAGDAPSIALAKRLRSLPLRVDRLKTGTPPRIDGKKVDFGCMEKQPGESPAPVMSLLGSRQMHPRQVPCYITHTNGRTHEIIRAGLAESPMFSGAIEGVGPRYCPSIEDKVVRFAERQQHQIFVEPEGLETTELYPNGISTSLSFAVQRELVASIRGFERAHITRPGYAIEYDFFDPRDLQTSLETKVIEGLFFAGQINGTTGYEEAAAQGLIAGVNAANKIAGRSAWTPQRHEAYIGVLIDDLTTLGADEPYRMFTSRAEYRLRLRQDNADFRLTPAGHELGLVSPERWRKFNERRASIKRIREHLARTRILKDSESGQALASTCNEPLSSDSTLEEFLRRPSVTVEHLRRLGWLIDETIDHLQQAEIEVKYEGHIRRQDKEIERAKTQSTMKLPTFMSFANINGLSTELKEKLSDFRPQNLDQASRIPGMTPAALSLLAVHIKKHGKELQQISA